MGMVVYENIMRRLATYMEIEVSEQQLETGHIKDARIALTEMKKNMA